MAEAILIGLASYAWAYTAARFDGPAGVFTWLRGRFDPDQRTWVGRGLNCPICLGLWASAMMVICWLFAPRLVMWFAAWGVVTLLVAWERR